VRRTALTPPHHRFEQWTLPLEVLLARPDVLHCPDFIAPARRPCPAVVTIHDLAFMHYPEILDASARAYYGQVTANAPRADAIIAVSESTRQDIAQFLDIPIEQIDVIHEAAAQLYTQIDLRDGEARVLNSTPVAADTFMLFVSTLEPRKNLPTLLHALRICIDRRPEAGYRLVIVGRRGWRDEEIFQTARDLKLADHVLFTGGVGQYDLRWLYNACRLYINPSLYEGFGLPLLEAMACGAPCLAAATSSLPEIGGDAAIYVPPLDAGQWADEIMALWDDDERRAELGRLGVARARQFSWARTARETLKVYRRAADRIVPRAEPAAPPRHAQPPEPLPDSDPAAFEPGASRPCLRCGTALLPGDLQIGVNLRSFESAHAAPSHAPRMWICPRCGYVELVSEPHSATDREQALNGAWRPSQPATLPDIVEVETPSSVLALEQAAASANPVVSLEPDSYQADAVASGASAEQSSSSDPAVLEADAGPAAETPASPPLAIEGEQGYFAAEDAPSVDLAEVDRPNSAIDAPAPAQHDQAELAVAAGVSAPIQDRQAESDGVGSPEAPGILAKPDGGASASLASPAPDAHTAEPHNGTPPNPKSGRAARRQKPSVEPGAAQPPKRRSSGSKRK
jgi:glycosyltransferase involved in cell wall biosynthesis